MFALRGKTFCSTAAFLLLSCLSSSTTASAGFFSSFCKYIIYCCPGCYDWLLRCVRRSDSTGNLHLNKNLPRLVLEFRNGWIYARLDGIVDEDAEAKLEEHSEEDEEGFSLLKRSSSSIEGLELSREIIRNDDKINNNASTFSSEIKPRSSEKMFINSPETDYLAPDIDNNAPTFGDKEEKASTDSPVVGFITPCVNNSAPTADVISNSHVANNSVLSQKVEQNTGENTFIGSFKDKIKSSVVGSNKINSKLPLTVGVNDTEFTLSMYYRLLKNEMLKWLNGRKRFFETLDEEKLDKLLMRDIVSAMSVGDPEKERKVELTRGARARGKDFDEVFEYARKVLRDGNHSELKILDNLKIKGLKVFERTLIGKSASYIGEALVQSKSFTFLKDFINKQHVN